MRKLSFLLLLIFILVCKSKDGLSESYFYFGFGPVWMNFLSVDTTNLKTDPETVRKSTFKINEVYGYGINPIAKFYIRNYLAPYISFFYYSLQKGLGSINTVDIKNKRIIDTVEDFFISPSEIGKLLTVANEMVLLRGKIRERDFGLELHLGYNRLTSTFKAVWPGDSSLSEIKWQGFVGGPKFYYYPDNKTTLLLYDYVIPDRYSVVSTRNSLLGIDSGSAEFIFFANILNLSVFRNIYKNFDLGLSLTWEYGTKVGKAKIDILDENEQNFINPKLPTFKSNIVGVFFSLVWSF